MPAPDDLLAAVLPGLAVARVPAPAPGPWLAGDEPGTPPFRLTRSAGRPCLWHPDRLAEIAGDLDAAAPLFDRIEAASGWRFEPARCLEPAELDGTVVSVSSEETTLELALPDFERLPALLRAAAEAMPPRGDRPAPYRLLLSGPALPVDQAATLSTGDLLLLPAIASVRVEGRAGAPEAPLTLELATGTLSRAAWAEDGAVEARSAANFAVPVSVALPPALIAPDALARAGEGAAVPLGTVADGAEVTLAVAGRSLGVGRIVRIGERFAIEIHASANEEQLNP